MFVALTGTPGTGKTTVGKCLKKKGFEVVFLNSIVKRNKLYKGFDKKRGSYIVDLKKVERYLKKKYGNTEKIVILDSHISHLLDSIVDFVIVLRCEPEELEKRLKKRKWKKEKIRENVEAEMVDVIVVEVEDLYGKNFVEINTSKKDLDEVCKKVERVLKDVTKNLSTG